MDKLAATLCTYLLTTCCAIAATAPAEAAEPERVGPMGIIIFVVLFVAMSVGMVGIAFWKKGGKGDDDKGGA